jgi:hypothetical protein
MVDRGVIANRDRAKQIISFRGLRFGNITPTDIDGLIEYKNQCFLLVEFKHFSKPDMPEGQRLALERLAVSLNKPTLLLHAIHYTYADEDIDAASCEVLRYFWRSQWHPMDDQRTVRELATGFFEKFERPFDLPVQPAHDHVMHDGGMQ